jgi:carboxypeptidase family protein
MKIQTLKSNHFFDVWHVLCPLLCALIVLLAMPLTARGQVVTAAVRGTVTDEQGAAIVGADVTITNQDTGYTRSMKTGTDGAYNFTDMPLGTYSVRVAHEGFKPSTQTGLVLHVADSLVVNVGLRVGAVTELVTVEASAVAVETTSGELTGLIQGSQVTELPLQGRNFMQLVTLMPGVAQGEGYSVANKGLKGGSNLSVSGSASNGNQWLVDGADNNDTGSQRTILVYPSTESIQEFKVERSTYGPEFGGMSGATVNLVTKSGSNNFHGSVYYSGRNDKLNSFDTILKAGCPTCPKNKFRGNDYGYTIGGPIKKDKVFFFWNQEWNKRIEGIARTGHVPTMGERVGDFSAIAACPGNSGGFNNAGFPVAGLTDPNPADGSAFGLAPNNAGTLVPAILPSDRTTSQGLLLMTQYPKPTLSDPCANENWTASLNTPTPWREENGRGDINLTRTLTLMLKYTHDSWTLGTPSAGFGWGSNPFGVIDESWDQPGQIVAAKLTKTIGNTAVNDFQFSYTDNRITIAPSNLALEQQINDAIPWNFPTSGKRYGDKGPSAWFSGWGNAHLPGVWTIAPWKNALDHYTWQDDFSVVRGRHTLKFGGLYKWNSKNEQNPNLEFGGIFGSVGYQGQWGNSTGYDVANMELKNMAISMSEASNILINDIRWYDSGYYAADNWRVNNRLTVNYGVRYELLPNPWFADDKYTSFNPSAFDAALGNATCNGLLYSPGLKTNPCPPGTGGIAGPNRALWNNNYHMLAPRLSLAWDPTGKGKWAIRAGAGQFFNRDRLFALQIGGNNPPFLGNFVDNNGRFLDSLNQPMGKDSKGNFLCFPNCFGTGLGGASVGGETSNQMPNSWQYNLTIQRELWRNTRLEVGYVGNRNLHWEIRSDVNAVHAADRLAYFQDNACTTGNGLCLDSGGNPISAGAARSALRPFGAMRGDNTILYYTHSGQSTYNSLQALFQTRFQRNSILQVAYTWSKLLSDTQLIDSPANNVDFYNPSANRGPDLLNRPQILSANFIYNLPALESQSAFVRQGFGSWELSSIISYATGPSVTPSINGFNFGDTAGTGNGGNENPMRVAGQPCRANNGNGQLWLNPDAYTMNGLQIGKLGSSGFGICSGPSANDVDFSLRKNFKLTERVKMQLQFDFFNLFNHPQYRADNLNLGLNFSAPQLQADNPATAEFLDSAGSPIYPRSNVTGSTGCGTNHLASPAGTSPQIWCASSIVNTTLTPNQGFGLVTQTRENGFRQIQYGLKFTF